MHQKKGYKLCPLMALVTCKIHKGTDRVDCAVACTRTEMSLVTCSRKVWGESQHN